MPQATPELALRLRAIEAFEAASAGIEDAFDWLRYLSTRSRTKALSRAEYTSVPEILKAAVKFPERLQAVDRLLVDAPLQAQEKFLELTGFFTHVRTADDLFDAVLRRHSFIQKNKPPEGKREWFEHAANGGVFVRSDYKLDQSPATREHWPRPYRLLAARNFCNDLNTPHDGKEKK